MSKYSQETAVGIFVFIGLACISYLSLQLGGVSLWGEDHYSHYQARFTSVQGLNPGSQVNMAGVPIGNIEAITLDSENDIAYVHFRISKDVLLYDDAIASVKTSGLIGDRYLHLSPGGSGIELEPGEIIVDTESAIDLESLIGKVAFGSVGDE